MDIQPGTGADFEVHIVDSNSNDIGAIYPLHVSSDAIYSSDIDVVNSTKVGWTGEILNPFLDLHTEIYNTSVTNPKVLYIEFHRALYLNSVGLGCMASTGHTFSNVKMEFIGSDGTVRGTYDDSANSTVYGTKLYSFAPTACIGIKFSFCTANSIGLTNITIQKEVSVSSRIKAIKPNEVVVDIGATYGGNLKSAICDNFGFDAYNTPTGEIRTTEPFRLVGVSFEGTTIDTKFWTAAATGTSASVAQSHSQVLLTSGTSNGAAVSLYSVRRARYVSGYAMRYRVVRQLGDIGTAGNKRRGGVGWGASMPTITDGAWFQLDGTEFSVVTCKGGVETKVTSFNGDLGTSITLNITVNTLEIYWTNSKVWFVVNGFLLHTFTASAETWADTMSFHAFSDSLNSGILAASVTMAVRISSIHRLGKYETQPIYYHLSGDAATHVLKLGAGVLHKIIFNNSSGTNLTIVDNNTGTTPVVGIITTTSAVLGIRDYMLPFNTGLILITTGNGLDATIIYE